nr:MAG TPA: hypothetical protein [Caudoviricetes sp.]
MGFRRWVGWEFFFSPLFSLFHFNFLSLSFFSSLFIFSLFLFLFNFLTSIPSPSKRHFFLIFEFWTDLILSF